MEDQEKQLIEGLFHRLKNTELHSNDRDEQADELIQKLVKKQPFSSYYMTQTILIQETAIKKMSIQIEELKKRIEELKNHNSTKKTSFLSNFFKSNSSAENKSLDDNVWKNDMRRQSHHINPNISSPVAQQTPIITRHSSFLSNALQTATGVAGGMILGNMLMNVFSHSKPEEEVMDTINHHESSVIDHDHEYQSDEKHDHFVDYETSEPETNTNISDNYENFDEIDHNDDNFI
jgi:hypothetical protein